MSSRQVPGARTARSRMSRAREVVTALAVYSFAFGLHPMRAPATIRLAQNWQDYSPRERYEALRNYRRHEQLPEDRQREVEKQYQRWQGMPEQERQKIRENYERYRNLSPRDQERIERRYRDMKRQGDQ